MASYIAMLTAQLHLYSICQLFSYCLSPPSAIQASEQRSSTFILPDLTFVVVDDAHNEECEQIGDSCSESQYE